MRSSSRSAFDGEIVSVDSAQVYRGMDIGTAKPDAATRARRPHHLLDLVDPTESYSAARFAHDALEAIDGIRGRGRVPIVAGGTMLYFKALTEGLSDLPGADPAVRAQIDDEARLRGWPALHDELARVGSDDGGAPPADRCAAHPAGARSVPHDRRAVVGAAGAARGAAARAIRFRWRWFRATARSCTKRSPSASTRCSMPDLSRSSRRCANAMRSRQGCRRCAPSATGRRGGTWTARSTRDALRATGIAATRQLAKRQITWLRATLARRSIPSIRAWQTPCCAKRHARCQR